MIEMIMDSTINNFFKSLSLTGIPMLDMAIITHMVPILLGYFSTMSGIITDFIKFISHLIYKFLGNKVKSKLTGNTVCRVKISHTHQLFRFLRDAIFDKNVDSDIKNTKFYNFIDTIQYMDENDDLKNHTTEKKYSKYAALYSDYEKVIELDIDYQVNKQDNILKSQSYCSYYDIQKKMFKFENYIINVVIRGNKQAPETNRGSSDIWIEVVSFESKLREKNEYVPIIEKFLNKRFGFKERFPYVYKLTFRGDVLYNLHQSLRRNNYKNVNIGKLIFGDDIPYIDSFKQPDGDKPKYVSNELVVGCDCANVANNSKNYTKNILVSEINNTLNASCKTFFDLYFKYTGEHFDGVGYGYFFDKGKLYLIFVTKDNMFKAIIVSYNKMLTLTNIQEEIDYLIHLCIGQQSNDKNDVFLYKRVDSIWHPYALDKRGFETIYLPDAQMNDIKMEIEKFSELEQFYKECQVPYKKGLLFHGPPGTGKTSLVKALAYEYQLDVYTINVNDEEVNDDTISNILNSLGGNKKILLFEDIDTAFADKEKVKNENKTSNNKSLIIKADFLSDTESDNDKNINTIKQNPKNKRKRLAGFNDGKEKQPSKKFLTYSGLLNAMDGILSNQCSVLTIMTTNYIDRLGPAFLRPGRIDRIFELGPCCAEQIKKMVEYFIKKRLKMIEKKETELKEYENKIENFINKLTDSSGKSLLKPCELQTYLLRHIENIDDIFKYIDELDEYSDFY